MVICIKEGVYMAFFDNLGKKVGEAAQNAAKKSNEFIEINKLNSSINAEEEAIKKIFTEIGHNVYDNHCADINTTDNYEALFEEIKEHELIIKNLRMRIVEIKKVKMCDACGHEMDTATTFCPKCGAKQEVSQPVEQVSETIFCPSCGAQIQNGVAFCGSCGQKVDSN
jgi:rubrerythrin